MDIKQMQYLITLADAGSYTLAARELSISQPSLSAFVAKTEDELGLKLFDRNTTPITTTYAGRIYIDSLRRICDKAELLDRRMNDISGRAEGTIKIGFSTDRAAYVLPKVLPVFRKRYPNVNITPVIGSSNKLLQMIAEDKLGMAVLPTDDVTEKLVRNELYEEELLLIDGGGHIRKEQLIAGMPDRVDPTKLDGIPLITMDENHMIRHFQDKIFTLHEVKPDIIMEVPSNMTAYRLATAGMGVAIVPGIVVDMTSPIGAAKTYRISVTGCRWCISAIYSRDVYVTDIDRAFINCVRRVMNDM